jgi:hypothetical protein
LLRADLRAIAELLEPGARVLDLGCGDGALLDYLRPPPTGEGTRHRALRAGRAGLRAPRVERAPGLSAGRAGRLPRRQLRLGDPEPDAALSQRPGHDAARDAARGAQAIVSFSNWGHWRCRLHLLLTGRIPVASDLPQQWYESPRRQPFTVTDFAQYCAQIGVTIDQQIYLANGRRIRTGRFKNLLSTTAVFTLRKHSL